MGLATYVEQPGDRDRYVEWWREQTPPESAKHTTRAGLVFYQGYSFRDWIALGKPEPVESAREGVQHKGGVMEVLREENYAGLVISVERRTTDKPYRARIYRPRSDLLDVAWGYTAQDAMDRAKAMIDTGRISFKSGGGK